MCCDGILDAMEGERRDTKSTLSDEPTSPSISYLEEKTAIVGSSPAKVFLCLGPGGVAYYVVVSYLLAKPCVVRSDPVRC
jgi:hypothetical protein